MTEPKFFADLYDLDGSVLVTVNLAGVGKVTSYKAHWRRKADKKAMRLYKWNSHKWPWWKPRGYDRDPWFLPEWVPPRVVIESWKNDRWGEGEPLFSFTCRSRDHATKLRDHLRKQLERYKVET